MTVDLERLRRAARDGDTGSAWQLWHEARRRGDTACAVDAVLGLADPELAGELAGQLSAEATPEALEALEGLALGFGVVLDEGLRERVERMCELANGQRRVRRLGLAHVAAALFEARSAPHGVAFRHAGHVQSSPSNPRSGVTLAVRRGDGALALGVAECGSSSPSPGRGWSELAPWRAELEANLERARAWANDATPLATRTRAAVADDTPTVERLRARLAVEPAPGDELDALLLAGERTEKTFKAIAKKLDGWPKSDTAGRDAALARAARALAEWPDEVRVATTSVWTRLEKGKDKPSDALLRHLQLDKVGATMLRAIAAAPAAARFTSMRLYQGRGVANEDMLSGEAFSTFARSPHLSGLRRLQFGSDFSNIPDFVPLLSDGGGLAALEALVVELPFNSRKDDPQRFASYALPAVQTLDLAMCRLGAAHIAALVSSPAIASVRELVLNLNDVDARAIAESPHLGALETLSLVQCGIDDDALVALADSPNLPSLHTLDLSGAKLLSPRALAALARSPHRGALRVLVFGNNRLQPEHIEALAGGPGLAGLESLTIRTSRPHLEREPAVFARGARALAAAPFARSLRHLELPAQRLGDEGARALGEAPFECLERLVMWTNEIGPEGARALAANPHLGRLEELVLNHNELGCEGFAALVRSPHLGSLRVLNVKNCGIGAEGARALAESEVLPALETVFFDGNAPQVAGTAALAASKQLERLRWLSLSTCTLGKGALEVLEASPYLVGRFTGLPGHRSDGREA